MLALGTLYEKGLVDESVQKGGMISYKVTQNAICEADTAKAFEYYDQASDTEPYALYKLGEFMEKGLYEDKSYRRKPSTAFALAFYRKASQHERGCREALYKLGEYY